MPIPRSLGMGTPFFHEFKKQASFFLREKIKHARLALTDVTPVELLTEDATSGNPWAPDAKTMSFISRAAFEIDDFWRIVQILHKRLSKFDRKCWREPYNALVLLEHLLTHGPESVADEFLCDKHVINELGNFQHIDERGFNWGLAVRKKSERVLQLLEKGPVLKEERDRARKVTRGIQGFGSFNQRWSSLGAMDGAEHSSDHFGRWNSHYEGYSQRDDEDHVSNFDAETDDQKKKKMVNQIWSSHGAMDGAENSSDYFGSWNSHYEGYSKHDDEDHGSNFDAEADDQKKKKKMVNQRWSSHGAMDGAENSSDYFGMWNSHYEGYSQQFDEDHGFNFDAETGDQKKKKKMVLTDEGFINGEITVISHERSVGEKVSLDDEKESLGFSPEESKLKIELQNEEHPFNNHELQRMESMLLLRQS